MPSWLPGWSSLTGHALPPAAASSSSSSSRNRGNSPPAYARRHTPSTKNISSVRLENDEFNEEGWPLARTGYSRINNSSSSSNSSSGARARDGDEDEDEEAGHDASSREQFLGSLYTTARSPKGPVYSGGGGGELPPYAPLPSASGMSSKGGRDDDDDDERGSGDSWHQ